MVLDYKNITFSFKQKRRRQRLRRLKLLALILVIIGGILLSSLWRQSGRLRAIQNLLLDGEVAEAETLLKKAESSIFRKQAVRELTALLHIEGDETGAAEKILLEMKDTGNGIRYNSFLERFLAEGKYTGLRLYSDFLDLHGEEVLFYQAAARTARYAAGESEKLLKKIDLEKRPERRKATDILTAINAEIATGMVRCVFDSNNQPVAVYDIKKKTIRSRLPGFDFSAFSKQLETGLFYINLTLDKSLHEIIDSLFINRYGSMVVLDLRDCGILAAYSKSRNGQPSNGAFSESYEPGSIIKVLTMLVYLQQGQQESFPFTCEGYLGLRDGIFYDRAPHGVIQNPSDALVLSCNLAFARMGMAVGHQGITSIFEKFHFNREPWTDRFLTFRTGSFDNQSRTEMSLANLSVGLELIEITTIHAAMIPAIIAGNGVSHAPYAVKTVKNILNLAFHNHSSQAETYLDPGIYFTTVARAMVRVVTSSEGTGRRSRVDFINFAAKTGTAGDSSLGLDSIFIGFFPAEKPRYAFAFRLERGGKAEWEGARFLKEFLTRWQKR